MKIQKESGGVRRMGKAGCEMQQKGGRKRNGGKESMKDMEVGTQR